MRLAMGTDDDVAQAQAKIAADFKVRVSYSSADMSKPQAIREMIENMLQSFGRLDILVNNAGIQHVAPLQDFPPERWDAILAINLSSAFHTTRLALPTCSRTSGVASSTSRRRTPWWGHRSNRPTSPPSTASSA
jgi:3-hydroxybutyrate dehydrogenase